MFKLFGGKKEGKKEGKFFRELKEEGVNGAVPAIKEAAKHVVEETKEAAKHVVEETTETAKQAVDKTSKAIKSQGKKGKVKNEAPKVEEDAPTVAEPKYEPVSIAEVVSRVKPVVEEEPQKVNFATEYMLTQTFSRRVPGGSLNKFKNMAREIKK